MQQFAWRNEGRDGGPVHLPHRLTSMAAAGCLALTVASCGDGDEPAPKPSTSTSKPAQSKAALAPSKPSGHTVDPSESAAPSVPASVKKPLRSEYPKIDQDTDSGAAAALQYFIAGYRYGLISGDPSVLEEMSSDSCTPCQSFISDINNPSRRLSKADWTVDEPRVEILREYQVDATAQVYSNSTLAPSGRSQEQTFYMGAIMEWKAHKWTAGNAALKIVKE